MVSLTRTKPRGSQSFGCGKEGHFITNCLEVKIKKNDSSKFDKSKYKKNVGEAHLGQEWDKNEESSDSDEEVGLATMAIEVPTSKSSLFEDITDDEDDFTHTCFMTRGPKVDPKTPSLEHDVMLIVMMKKC